MFDPTIFDNLKIVLEGAVYDLDLAGEIMVSNRKDVMDLAAMARTFSIEFQSELNDSFPTAEIKIHAPLKDLAAELLNRETDTAGCQLEIFFYTKVNNIDEDCHNIEEYIKQQWQNRPTISQELSFMYGTKQSWTNTIALSFGRTINEEQIEDILVIVEHTLKSLRFLDAFSR